MPSEIQIRCFMKVADRLSFTKAAAELFITQQACSKYISLLEKELAFPLFIRSTRKVALTRDGEILYNFFLKSGEEYSAIIQNGRHHFTQHLLDINFGLMNGTSPSILMDSVVYLKEIFPDIKLNWIFSEQHALAKRVLSGEIDIALMFHEGADAHPYLLWKELFSFHGYVLISSHLAEKQDSIPYDVLEKLPFAAHMQFGLSNEDSMKEAKGFLKKFGLPYKNILLYETIEDSIASVETGESFTVTPPVFQHAYYVPYLNKYPMAHIAKIGCVWNPGTSNPYIEKIVDIIAESVRKSDLYTQLSAT